MHCSKKDLYSITSSARATSMAEASAQGPGPTNVHHELELRRLLNRKIARLNTLEDLFDLACGTTVEIMKTRSKCYQTARIHHFP